MKSKVDAVKVLGFLQKEEKFINMIFALMPKYSHLGVFRALITKFLDPEQPAPIDKIKEKLQNVLSEEIGTNMEHSSKHKDNIQEGKQFVKTGIFMLDCAVRYEGTPTSEAMNEALGAVLLNAQGA